MKSIPAHKQTDPDKLPGQIVHPLNHDMMDDTAEYGRGVMPDDSEVAGMFEYGLLLAQRNRWLQELADRTKAHPYADYQRRATCEPCDTENCKEHGVPLAVHLAYAAAWVQADKETSDSYKPVHGGYPE